MLPPCGLMLTRPGGHSDECRGDVQALGAHVDAHGRHRDERLHAHIHQQVRLALFAPQFTALS